MIWLCNKNCSKNATGYDTFEFAKKTNVAGLKSDIDILDIDELKTNPLDLSNLSNVVNNEVVKKTVYNDFVENVNAIQTTDASNFMTKSDFALKSVKMIENFPIMTYKVLLPNLII